MSQPLQLKSPPTIPAMAARLGKGLHILSNAEIRGRHHALQFTYHDIGIGRVARELELYQIDSTARTLL